MKNLRSAICALLTALVVGYPVIESCDDVPASGPYTMKIDGFEVDLECDADTDGGGWMTILARREPAQNFYQNWRTYADDGIGSPETEYFLPLNFLHYITSEVSHEMLVEMKENNVYAWDFYRTISIASEEEKFKLTVGDFEPTSTAGNGFDYHNNMRFSTYDNENDLHPSVNCAVSGKTAGWFNQCFHVNLFGEYDNSVKWRGVNYNTKFQPTQSMDFLTIKIRKPKCANGFGSTCATCLPDFYLPVYHLYPRYTCLHECTVANCEACAPKVYPFCTQCKEGFVVNKKGKCKEQEPRPPCGPEDPEEGGDKQIVLANCNINFYNYDSKIENLYIKSKEANVHLKPEEP